MSTTLLRSNRFLSSYPLSFAISSLWTLIIHKPGNLSSPTVDLNHVLTFRRVLTDRSMGQVTAGWLVVGVLRQYTRDKGDTTVGVGHSRSRPVACGGRGAGPPCVLPGPLLFFAAGFRPRLTPMGRAGPCCKIFTLRSCPGDTAIPGMTSLNDVDLQHSSALAKSPKEI